MHIILVKVVVVDAQPILGGGPEPILHHLLQVGNNYSMGHVFRYLFTPGVNLAHSSGMFFREPGGNP